MNRVLAELGIAHESKVEADKQDTEGDPSRLMSHSMPLLAAS